MIRFTTKLSTLILFLVYSSKKTLIILLKGIKEKRCLFCGEVSSEAQPICPHCYQDLPWNTFPCSRCALPLPKPNPINQQQIFNIECGECIAVSPVFTQTVACFQYDTPIDKAIHLLKYRHKLYFATLFSYQLAKKIKETYPPNMLPSLLIPVPMHHSKLKRRGFNQAQLISQKISRQLSIENNPTILQKVIATPPQTGLSKVERVRNLRNAFHLSDSVVGLHIALVDDVVTTRATIEILGKLLVDAGAKRVDVWCIARTPKHRNQSL